MAAKKKAAKTKATVTTRPGTFPVQIEYSTKAITAYLHALPRPGDRIQCAFPSGGIPSVFLIVRTVTFRQTSDFDGKVCREPFGIVVWTEDDPDLVEHNKAAFKKALKTWVEG